MPNDASPVLNVYIDQLSLWYPPDQVLSSILDNLGAFNHALLAFWLQPGQVADVATAWSDGTTFPADAIDKFHAAGVKVMVSAGGGTETPITSGLDPKAYGTGVAQFAKQYGLDGVDLDIEDTPAFEAGTATDWLVTVTEAIKDAMPDAIVSHAPQAPYFMSSYKSNYLQVEQQAGSLIDFYNVQFYNQDTTGYDTYETLFVKADGWAAGSSVGEIHAAGIPLEKILVGKPMVKADADNTGYVPVASLASFIEQGIAAGIASGGAMTWQWNIDTLSTNAEWSEAVAKAF